MAMDDMDIKVQFANDDGDLFEVSTWGTYDEFLEMCGKNKGARIEVKRNSSGIPIWGKIIIDE